ncbi:MAG: hypothetical protein K0Q87_4698 [Neobacillus sp.]|nr:hypothetical protein [Neobacillus sp.]
MNKEQQILEPSKIKASAGFSTSVKVGGCKLINSEKSAIVTIHTEAKVGAHFGITLQHTMPVRTFEVKEATPTRTIPEIVIGVRPLLTHICHKVANDLINRSKEKIKVKENSDDTH